MNMHDVDELGYYSRQTFYCWKDLFWIVDSEELGNLFLNSLPSGLLRRRGLLNRLNHRASFIKIISACAWRQFTRKHTYKETPLFVCAVAQATACFTSQWSRKWVLGKQKSIHPPRLGTLPAEGEREKEVLQVLCVWTALWCSEEEFS
jgi:hypothetical protein